jgi:hypothetical protein
MTVTVSIDTSKIRDNIEERIGRAQLVLDNRIAADSNYFCPKDSGDLQGSVFPIWGNGELEWKEPYSRTQYYLFPNKSKDSNPNAAPEWVEHAKARDMKEWEALANEEYNR